MSGDSFMSTVAVVGRLRGDAVAGRMSGNLVTLKWVAQRWLCAPEVCQRFLEEQGAVPTRIGVDARHMTLGFELFAVLAVERGAGGQPKELGGAK